MSTLFSQSSPTRSSKTANTGCVRTLFSLFFFIGAFILFVDTVRPAFHSLLAQRWVETPCVVDSSSVVRHPSRRHSTYSIEVIYHYEFSGQTYSSNRYLFTSATTSARASKQRIVDHYPPGAHKTCYVNPSAPSEAVIDRNLQSEMATGGIGLPFLLIGGAGLFFAPWISGARRMTQHAVPKLTPTSGEPVPLKPQSTPFGKFVFMTFFALFWNGFIGIFFYLTFLSHDSSVTIFMKIFVGVFTAVGVLIALGAISSFFALFNPRVQVTARTNGVPLGGNFQFQWSFGGHAQKLTKLRIVLEGREEAVCRSGKETQTATQIFAEIPIIETGDHDLIAQGQGSVAVPAGLMHTFYGRQNKIMWRIRVHAELPHWAPIEEDYPINVLPRPITS